MKAKKNKSKSKVGRPSKYDETFNEQVYKYCLLGATDIELSKLFNTCEKTINTWKRTYPEFLQSIRAGKEIADAEVAEKLFKRATGYKFTETHFEKIDSKGNLEILEDKMIQTELYKKKLIVKELAPDPTAQIFWLKNRQPKSWRDKQEHELSGKDGKPIELLNNSKPMTDEELRAFKKRMEDI